MSIKNMIKRNLRYMLNDSSVKNITANIAVLAPNELLKGRTAIVTGGTSGIGFEIARAFINAGADVVVTSRNAEKSETACKLIKEATISSGEMYGIELDNTKVSNFSECFEQILSLVRSHRVDILVNNAGLVGGDIRNCEEEKYDAILDTNLKGAFFLTQLVAKYMKDCRIEGNILNIGSSSSLRPATSAYTISKWGIRGLTLGMAKVLAPYGITVNAIAPGPTATPMLMPNGVSNDIKFPKNPIGRYARPEEIANMAVFLVSPMGRTIVGDMIFMTGGAGLITFDDINYSF